MSRALLWIFAGLFTVSITALASAPAVWLVPLIDAQTDGRFSLADVQGSLWQGSAVIGAAAARDDVLAPLLPGRCVWRISPWVMIGMLDIRLENEAISSAPINIHGDWSRLKVEAGNISLPADGLAALGAPLNTIRPAGLMRASWPTLTVTRTGRNWQINGQVQIDLTQMMSALSPVKPLGAYRVQLDLLRGSTRLNLQTLSGPLHLTGKGNISDGSLKFSGQAWAQEGEEARLSGLLNLLGQRRQVENRNVIALEFQ
jgi:general secretion pathway protein N